MDRSQLGASRTGKSPRAWNKPKRDCGLRGPNRTRRVGCQFP
jgi:hypothetical protein